ncbi:MAG: hypothetical protein R3E57_12060 [Porticoccaceae bacterium]
MSAFMSPDKDNLRDFLNQFVPGEVTAIEATYQARNHLTCRFRSTSPQTNSRYLLVAALPGGRDRLEYAGSLIPYLIQLGLPITPCIPSSQGEYVALYGDCPALLLKLPEGLSPKHGDIEVCRQIGSFLGKMHAKSQGFEPQYCNPRSLLWLNFAAEELSPLLSTGNESLLREQLNRFRRTVESVTDLPSGPLIGSIFPDQLFFQGGKLEAVSGFYFSCTDWLLLDVAQAVNEWCCQANGELDKHLCQALLNAYRVERPFTHTEGQYWQDILCFSATRFWVSRLLTSLTGEPSTTARPPEEYQQKLQRRLMGYYPLPIQD